MRIITEGASAPSIPNQVSLTSFIGAMKDLNVSYPSHPGEILLEDVLPHYEMTISEAASRLDITRANLSKVLNGKATLTADLAAKVEKAFGVNAELLLAMMANWSLAKARSNPDLRSIERVPEPA